jgi:uncharacterized protein with HEPN domain
MRNRMAHGYFDINLETVQTSLPLLERQLKAARDEIDKVG